MAEIGDVIDEIVNQLRDKVTGLRRIPDAPPESNDQFPFAVVYPVSGSYSGHTPEDMVGLHDINIELHILRKDLPRNFDSVIDLQDDIPNALLVGIKDSDFSDLITFGDITYTFGALEWAGVQTLGVTYTVSGVKVTANL